MAKIIKSFEEFALGMSDHDRSRNIKRFKELYEFKETQPEKHFYAIQLSFDIEDEDIALLEHVKLKQFSSTRNRYVFHPEDPKIPVRAHYHVYPPNSTNKELYAVNMDGTAHHKKNRGIEIPKKEADEFRAMGVDVDPSNILEMLELPASNEQQLLLESLQNEIVSVFLIFEV